MADGTGPSQTRCAAGFLTTAQLLLLPDEITTEKRQTFEQAVSTLSAAASAMEVYLAAPRTAGEAFSVGRRATHRVRVLECERERAGVE